MHNETSVLQMNSSLHIHIYKYIWTNVFGIVFIFNCDSFHPSNSYFSDIFALRVISVVKHESGLNGGILLLVIRCINVQQKLNFLLSSLKNSFLWSYKQKSLHLNEECL